MRNITRILTIATIVFVTLMGYSAVTRFMGDSTIRDFEKGSFVDIALNQEGYLSLSPKTKELFTSQEILYVWCLAEDSKGNVYFGTGNKARIYRISPSGKLSLHYKAKSGVSISSIAVDSQDNLYASVMPGGEIIKVKINGDGSRFASLKEKYIWKLKVDSRGNLYAATGKKAAIYQISPVGQPKLVYSNVAESHFLSLAINNKDEIFFGSSGKGIVYKLNKKTSDASVLYDSYEGEIKDVVADDRGNIYFATATKTPAYPPTSFDYTDTFVLYGAKKDSQKSSKRVPLKNLQKQDSRLFIMY